MDQFNKIFEISQDSIRNIMKLEDIKIKKLILEIKDKIMKILGENNHVSNVKIPEFSYKQYKECYDEILEELKNSSFYGFVLVPDLNRKITFDIFTRKYYMDSVRNSYEKFMIRIKERFIECMMKHTGVNNKGVIVQVLAETYIMYEDWKYQFEMFQAMCIHDKNSVFNIELVKYKNFVMYILLIPKQ